MRVVHVVSTFPPYRGGMGNVAKEIAVRTAAQGYEVMVVTPRSEGSGKHVALEVPTPTFQLRDVRPWLRFGNASWCPSIRRILDGFRPDLVHLHWPFMGGIAPVLAWRRRGEHRRLVVQYHMDLVAPSWRGAVFAAYTRRALPAVLRAADRIVVSSFDYARHGALAPYVGALGERLVEIPLGVSPERFTPARRQERASREQGMSTVLFVGGLDRAHAFKGLSVLLAAIARVPDAHLSIVGDGDLRPAYEAQARALGIADRVEFLRTVADAALPMVYRAADVFVLPSTNRSEAFGLVLLEAMACGTPVIASDLPGVRTVVGDGEIEFLVPPGDPAALAERVRQLTHDPVLRDRVGAAGRHRAEERYAWDRVIAQWGHCYGDLYKTPDSRWMGSGSAAHATSILTVSSGYASGLR